MESPPAHKTLIDSYLDWSKVKARLSRYEHIRDLYTIDGFKNCSEKGPF